MDQFIDLAQDLYYVSLLVGIVMLIFGGHLLVEGSVAIAKRLGISTLVIGLTVVAFSTSSPELALNIVASINGHGDLSLGNIFGSNIANLGLVLGIGALICKLPVTSRIVKIEFPWLVVLTVVVGLVTIFGTLNWIWAIVFLCFFVYLMLKWFKIGKESESKVAAQSGDVTPEGSCSAFAAWVMLIGGLILLGVGGKATEIGAVSGAVTLGMSKILIGGTIVAIATSLPEIVTTIIAAKKGHPDLAVGNVIGSNIFNILFVLPITMLINPIPTPNNVWVYVVVMVLMTLLAWILSMRDKKGDNKIKPYEGAILVGSYVFFLVGISLWR
jgi:cation:H+ antiporter